MPIHRLNCFQSRGITTLQNCVSFAAYKAAMEQNGLNIDTLQSTNTQTIETLTAQITALNQQIAYLEQTGGDAAQIAQLRASAEQLQGIVTLLRGNSAAIGGMETYLTQISAGIAEITTGVNELKTNYAVLDAGIRELAVQVRTLLVNMTALRTGIDTLVTEYGKLDAGIRAYTGGVAEIVAGYSQLVTGADDLLAGSSALQSGTDPAGDLSLRALAKTQGLNASYLSSLFRRETGETITQHINRKRMQLAVRLLSNTRLQIHTVAQHCGIPDVNYFSKLFKKHTSHSPKEYRKTLSSSN